MTKLVVLDTDSLSPLFGSEPLIAKPDASLRATLIVAQLIGIAMLRHLARAEHVVRATDEELVRLVGPAMERYLR